MKTTTGKKPRQLLVNFARTRVALHGWRAEEAINDVIGDGGAHGTVKRAMYDYYTQITDKQAVRIFREVER